MRRIALNCWYWFLDIPWLYVLGWTWPLCGLLMMAYGAWLVFKPAGFITAGALIILDSLHASFNRRAPK